MKKALIIIGLLILVGVIVGINLKKGDKAIVVQTEKVFRDDITQTVTGNGRIYPTIEVKIAARVSGKIIALDVEEGDSVKAGQVLVRLERDQYVASLEKSKSALLEARANLTLAESGLRRTQELYQRNLASRADLDEAQAKYDQALSRLQQAEASVKEAEDALRKTVLVSPINGVVIKKNKEVGEVALGSQFQEDVILVVADLKTMEARVEVNENDIINVNPGDTAMVEIDAFPDSLFPGVVTEISNSAKTTGAGTMEEVTNFEVRIRLFNRLPDFRPGMSAMAEIATETHKNVLNVPIQSVTVRERQEVMPELSKKELQQAQQKAKKRSKKTKKYKREDDLVEVVFVVEDGVAHIRPVKLGISDDNYYEVLSGLKEGEEVVTGPFRVLTKVLKDGDRVKVRNVARKES